MRQNTPRKKMRAGGRLVGEAVGRRPPGILSGRGLPKSETAGQVGGWPVAQPIHIFYVIFPI